MHKNNQLWLADLKKKYPESFINAKVLELGSLNINGSVRVFFENCDYTGIDKVKGKNVDKVILAHQTRFGRKKFDTLIAFSMFEHDPYWHKSLAHNIKWLKSDGMIFICFGAEGNLEHLEDFKSIPKDEFINYLQTMELDVLEHFWEEERYGENCKGAYDVIARKK